LAATAGAEFVADVTQRELLVLAEGQSARGTMGGSDAPLEGVVRARPRALDSATGLGTVRVALTSAGADQLPVGAFARVVVTTGSHEAASVIPTAALRGAVADGAEVVVCAGDKAKLVTVKVGWRDDAHVEILSALGADDSVAVDHVLALDDDTPIKRVQ
jgi:hypothetical protein